MNKDLIVSSMTASFKEANISLAIKKGMSENEARKTIDSMSDSINFCMDKVFDSLIENFPIFIK